MTTQQPLTENNAKAKNTVHDLIAIARDGDEFYSEAAEKVQNTELAQLFRSIATSKRDIVTKLSCHVTTTLGQNVKIQGTFVGGLQHLYGRLRSLLGDNEYGWVSELEESEDRLLHAFKDASKDTDLPQETRNVILELLPEVRGTHNTMRDRKHAMQG